MFREMVEVTVRGPASGYRRSPSPPQKGVGAEKKHQQIRSEALRIEQNFIEEDRSKAVFDRISHWWLMGQKPHRKGGQLSIRSGSWRKLPSLTRGLPTLTRAESLN